MHVQNLMNSRWDIRIFSGLVPKESPCMWSLQEGTYRLPRKWRFYLCVFLYYLYPAFYQYIHQQIHLMEYNSPGAGKWRSLNNYYASYFIKVILLVDMLICARVCVLYEGHLESKERFAIQRYLLIIGKTQNMQVLSHTFTYFST